ncbi:hypothetical protein QO002_001146 [Pararhizobium capsulatum DSM 1112]|uniref:Rap1a immunity protein domain-containing protein n=1 Tax=Pararhizobium capsulatum DSM 1112 TaxID=1121113 RepID=A0ABU0BL82_9HYPH|nr:hypothetical protein [Pararhizobium capsulatum]MDQ0319008.1 hypothetical protein [Pararhizobium capsulatum DSM 1112]
MIRKIFTAGSFLLLSSTMSFADIQDACKGMSLVAESIMIERQKGKSPEQIRNYWYGELVNEGHSNKPSTVNTIEYIIESAFQASIGNTLAQRQQFVDAMKQGIYLSCMRNSHS